MHVGLYRPQEPGHHCECGLDPVGHHLKLEVLHGAVRRRYCKAKVLLHSGSKPNVKELVLEVERCQKVPRMYQLLGDGKMVKLYGGGRDEPIDMPAKINAWSVFRDLSDQVVLNCNCHGVAAPSGLLEPGDEARLLPCANRAAQGVKIVQCGLIVGFHVGEGGGSLSSQSKDPFRKRLKTQEPAPTTCDMNRMESES